MERCCRRRSTATTPRSPGGRRLAGTQNTTWPTRRGTTGSTSPSGRCRADVESTAMRWDILPADGDRWRKVLTSFRHDVYHLPEYLAIEARRHGAEPVAVLAVDG